MIDNAKKLILEQLKPLMDECGFKSQGDLYQNESRAFKVEYDEQRKQFVLQVADVTADETGEFSEKSSWLFDESHGDSDARAIGEDFRDSLKESMGMKVAFTRPSDVSLPSKHTPGSTPGIEALTQRFLTLFPQFKDDYKENVATYGEFLYDHFYTKNAVPLFREMLENKNKKQINKMIEMLEEFYNEGDRVVVSTIAYSILGPTIDNRPELWDTAVEYMEDAPVLKQAGRSVKHYLETHEKRERLLFWQRKK